MKAIASCRCPSCGVLNALEQPICLRCLATLPSSVAMAPAEAATGETCRLYRAAASPGLLLLARTVLEYTTSGVSFTTPWSNLASITHTAHDDQLWLYQTPQQIKLALGSSHEWFSDLTRTVPLRQFGYPANQELIDDLCRSAPQLRRYVAV